MSNFSKMIERMEDLVLSGMGVPLTPLTVVNSEKLLPQLDRIRESLPEEIHNAKRVLDQREDIISEAQQRASQMMMDAKKHAEALLSESELLKAVHIEAERIRQQILSELEAVRKKAFEEAETLKAKAHEESRQVREGADQYAEAVLASLDKSLGEFHGAIRNGRKHLKQSQLDAHASNAKAAYAQSPINHVAGPSPLPQSANHPQTAPQVSSPSNNNYPLPGYPTNSHYSAASTSPLFQPSSKVPVGAGVIDTHESPMKDRAKIEAFLKQTTLS